MSDAGVAKLVNAWLSKSHDLNRSCGFESRLRHKGNAKKLESISLELRISLVFLLTYTLTVLFTWPLDCTKSMICSLLQWLTLQPASLFAELQRPIIIIGGVNLSFFITNAVFYAVFGFIVGFILRLRLKLFK